MDFILKGAAAKLTAFKIVNGVTIITLDPREELLVTLWSDYLGSI